LVDRNSLLFLPTLAWSECEKMGVNLAKEAEKPLNNYPSIGIKPTIKLIFVLFLNP